MSTEKELSEAVYRSISLDISLNRQIIRFVDTHPDWTADRVINCAVSRFLLEKRLESDDQGAKAFIHEMFNLAKKNGQQSAP